MTRWIAFEVTVLFLVCITGLVCCQSCHTTDVEPPVVVTATDASTPASICAKLVSLGCTIDASTCQAGFASMLAPPALNPPNFGCIQAATTKAAVQQCSSVGVQGCP
jgi:hypothetical protein